MIRPDGPTAARIAADRIDGHRTALLRIEHQAALAAADRLTGPARDRFRGLVGHAGQRLDVGGVGVHPVATDPRTGTFELSETGPQAIILPVRPAPNSHGVPLLDLVGWLPREGQVFTRFGSAVLGWLHVDSVAPIAPVAVRSDPGAWARAGGEGVTLIDWTRAWAELGHLQQVLVDSVALGRRLDAALQPPPVRRPEILVRQEAVAA